MLIMNLKRLAIVCDHNKPKEQSSITKHEWGIGNYNEPKTV